MLEVMRGLVESMREKGVMKLPMEAVRYEYAAGMFDTLLYAMDRVISLLIETRTVFPWKHCLVLADRKVSGTRFASPEEVEDMFEKALLHRSNGKYTARLVIIDPEIETWLWGVKPMHWREALRAHTGRTRISQDAVKRAFHRYGKGKPEDPKRAVEGILRELNVRKSAKLYGEIARHSSKRDWDGCSSPSFHKVYRTLKEWFG